MSVVLFLAVLCRAGVTRPTVHPFFGELTPTGAELAAVTANQSSK